MESRLNTETIDLYANNLTTKLVSGFFISTAYITGKEILNFCPVKQINFFILKNIFEAWQKENERFKSPYFNYDAPEVKAAFQDFLNVVSQNILVSREVFKPLLLLSVKETLLLILSPYDYFSVFIKRENKSLSVEKIKELGKYLVVNKSLLNEFARKLENESSNEIPTHQAIHLLNKACEELLESPDDIEQQLGTLNSIHPLKVADFYVEEKIETVEAEREEIKPAPEAKPEIPKPVSTVSEFTVSSETIVKTRVVEKFATQKTTLNEAFKSEGKTSVAERLQKTKVQTLRSVISLNERFLYSKELFKGSTQEFSDVIGEIDSCQSLGEVKNLITSRYIPKYGWQTENEAYQDFLHLIQRKFE